MKKFYVIPIIIVSFVILLSGCKKDHGDPPVLPPIESMLIDFSNFDIAKKSGDPSLTKSAENSNWLLASGVALFWKGVIYTTLAVPVKSFQLALENKASFIADKTWQWSYSVSLASVTYKARLTGEIGISDVVWKMYITKEGTGGYADFLWFEGTSKLDGSGGRWDLNHSPQFNEDVLQIDWTKSGTSVSSVKYTYVRYLNDARSTELFRNSYIEYGRKTGTLDAFYNISIYYYDRDDFIEMNVEWSTAAGNGHVRCPKIYSDELWYCWNAEYMNVECLP